VVKSNIILITASVGLQKSSFKKKTVYTRTKSGEHCT